MRNAFGLRFVYLFFNIPFLYLQRETLQRQLKTNTEEIKCSDAELECYQETPEADYDTFMSAITQRRRQAAEVAGASALSDSPESKNRKPLGGGQPIPGQIFSAVKEKSVSQQPSSFNVQASCSDSSTSIDPGSCVKRTFVQEHETSKTSAVSQMHNVSDDEDVNGMVRTVEVDFETDDELKEKMSRLIKEMNSDDSPYPPILAENSKVSDSSITSDDQLCDINRKELNGSIRATAAVERFEQSDSYGASTIPTSACMSTSEFDAWLGNEDAFLPTYSKEESSEKEVGIDTWTTHTHSSSAVNNTANKERKKKRGEKSSRKKKTTNIVSDEIDDRALNNELKSKSGNILEGFLVDTELTGYDPL